MTPVFKLQRDDISPSIRRYATEMKKGMREVTRSTAKGITRRVIDITPPSRGDNQAIGRSAYNAGANKIAEQMNAILAPKKLKGRRKITTVFGHPLRRPVYVPTVEKYPNVRELYRSQLHASGTGVGISTGRTRGRKFYVDVGKFSAELKRRQASVGKLAAGWYAAAQALDVPVQQWISRHGGSGGRVQIDTAGDRMRVTVENFASGVPPNVRAELARRIPYAVEYQRAAMERAIDGYHQRLKTGRVRAAA